MPPQCHVPLPCYTHGLQNAPFSFYSMSMNIPKEVQKILHTLEAAGFEGFVVGGCVRDMLRGVAPKDWDITTSATPTQVKALFPRTFDTGIQHGTITVLQGGKPFEVTTYRIDGTYTDARRPDSVTFTAQIEEDLSRRDFTINAIAYNPTHGFADPFNGRADITRQTIRCVGNPTHRFTEDALRMLRAVRFAGTLGFVIDPAAINAITALRENLTRISAERIREELTRLLCGTLPGALSLLESTGLLPYVLRGTPYPAPLAQTVQYLESAPTDETLRLSLFFTPFQQNGSAPTVEKIMRDLRYDNKTIHAAALFARLLPHPIPAERYAIKKILQQLPQDLVKDSFEKLLALQQITGVSDTAHNELLRQLADDVLSKNEPYLLKHLAINGDDLHATGFPRGKEMGAALAGLLDAILREPAANEKQILLNRLHGGEK